MIWLNPSRWLLAGGLIAALVLGYSFWADHIGDTREAVVRAEYTAAALVASEAARAKEAAWQTQLKKAQDDATKRQTKLAADAAALRTERNGLRDQLATAGRQLPGASCGSVREYAATLNAVFDQCSGEIEGLAREAGGHASDSLMYQESWLK